MYGISAARPSAFAAANAAAIRSAIAEPLDDLGQVLVAAAADSVKTS